MDAKLLPVQTKLVPLELELLTVMLVPVKIGLMPLDVELLPVLMLPPVEMSIATIAFVARVIHKTKSPTLRSGMSSVCGARRRLNRY